MKTESPLLTDQYELVMAYGYWQLNKAEQEAVFHLYFRQNPFSGNYTVCCGLEKIIDFLHHWHFSEAELDYLRHCKTANNTPLFSEDFINYLKNLRFTGDIDGIVEGSIVFPHEPLLRITAPILQCQLLETALINFIQFSSLIATKATRICQAAQSDPVIEFGLRRAQGPDGGLIASRAAYIGGCVGTSNTLAGQQYDIPIYGTQAHSWIMAFDDELTAFKEFARVMPSNTTLLVDTYNTLQGIRNAITVGQLLQHQGQELQAIRLDSGDLVELSRQARQLLDASHLKTTKILASGDLDEYTIMKLKSKNPPIDIWAAGTRLLTAYDHPALDMVYKLAAVKNSNQSWNYKIKISDSIHKSTIPGIHQVRRYFRKQKFLCDVLYDVTMGLEDSSIHKEADHHQDLLIPIFRQGKLVYKIPSIHHVRDFCLQQVDAFLTNVKNKHYDVHIDSHLNTLQKRMRKNY